MHPERFHRLRTVLECRQPDLTILMDRVNKSHNFSAILRNCDAVGVLRAHVVPPEEGLVLHHGTSAGTRKWVQVHRHKNVEDAARVLKQEGYRLIAAHPSEAAVDFREADYTSPTAILVGAELHGVSEAGLETADLCVRIPMTGMVKSLNVSVATSLLLFEAFRQRQAAGMYEKSRLSPSEFEQLLFEWSWPSVAAAKRRDGKPYPSLGADGEILPESD
ncbi:MAG: tRNA (guanosine(18)-2'-O)-methyltransferase TrmH [Gemmatimonadota bacterium]|nr:tRNA (guanosine(18)-2'-O)-methyltransferase TrmH [Gemmatimonadota bacterium]